MCSSRCVCLLAAWVQCLFLAKAGADLESGLVGYWPLDGHSTNLAVNQPGGFQGKSQARFLPGLFSKGIEFQHEPPLLLAAAVDFNQDLTYSVWFRFDETFTLLQDPEELLKVHVRPVGTKGHLFFNSPDQPVTELTLPHDGRFHLLTITSNPSGLKLFIDSDLAYARKERPSASFDVLELGTGQGMIDDVALWNRALTEPEISRLWGTGRALGDIVTDLDEDRLPDFWEQQFGLVIGTNDELTDPDADGLPNAYEYLIGTNPLSADTDADGLTDAAEDRTGRWASPTRTGTDPVIADSDGDRLLDGEEVTKGIDPNREDTDGDGESDWTENHLGTDPNVPEPLPALGDALVAYWPFDAGLDDEIQSFASKASGSPITFAPGQFHQGALLNGTDQSIEVEEPETSSAFDLGSGNFSVSAWVTFDPASSTQPVLLGFAGKQDWGIHGTSSGEVQFQGSYSHFTTTGGAITFNFGSALPERIPLSSALPIRDGDLHHVVLVVQGGQSVHYIDGVKKSGPNLFNSIRSGLSIDFIGPAGGNGNEAAGSFFDLSEEDEPAEPVPGKLTFGFDPNAAAPSQTFWKGMIDDVGIWSRALTESEVHRIWNGGTGRSLGEILHPEDDDADGLPDAWESSYTSSKADLSADEDPDQDGLNNLAEFHLRTHPLEADTDGDGLQDGVETGTGLWLDPAHTGTDPKHPDSDRDRVDDGTEASDSNPNEKDSDNDGHSDGIDPAPRRSHLGPTLEHGLLAYWPFDSDPYGLIGSQAVTAPQGRPMLYTDARHGSGLSLNGSEESVFIRQLDSRTLDFHDQSFTCSCWFQSNSVFRTRALISSDQWELFFDRSGFLRLQTAREPTSRTVPQPIQTDSSWHHLAVTTDALRQTATIYLDGNLLYSQDNVFVNPGPAQPILTVGASLLSPSTPHWSGSIDELAFWNRPLSGDEVRELYFSKSSIQDRFQISEDSDDDGILDRFERIYFPNDLTLLHGEGDFDNDGITDAAEFQKGTNPTLKSSIITHFKMDDPESLWMEDAVTGKTAGEYITVRNQEILFRQPALASGHAVSFNHDVWKTRSYGKAQIPELKTFTASLWLRQEAPQSEAHVLFLRGETPFFPPPYALAIDGNNLQWQTRASNELEVNIELEAKDVIKPGTTHNIAITYLNQAQARVVTLFVDGHEVATRNHGLALWTDDASSPFFIGGTDFGGGFVGLMDDFQLYDDALAPAQIRQLYHTPGSSASDVTSNDASEEFRVLRMNHIAGDTEITWASTPGRSYEVLQASHLEGPWRLISDSITMATEEEASFLLRAPEPEPESEEIIILPTEQYFRVRVLGGR